MPVQLKFKSSKESININIFELIKIFFSKKPRIFTIFFNGVLLLFNGIINVYFFKLESSFS